MLEQLDEILLGSDLAEQLDWPSRRLQPVRLAQDLHALGEAMPAPVDAAALPVIRTAPEAMGALYVFEGATLGGRQILPHLLGLEGAQGATMFFAGAGDEVPTRWKTFREVLPTAAVSTQDVDAMSATAASTFAALEFVCRTELERPLP